MSHGHKIFLEIRECEDLPVKVRPKTSSSGGTICLGVVVFVIDSALAFMSGNWAIASSCDRMLYGLWRWHWEASLGAIHDFDA